MSDMYFPDEEDMYDYDCRPDMSCPDSVARFLLQRGWQYRQSGAWSKRQDADKRTQYKYSPDYVMTFTWDQAVACETVDLLMLGTTR